MDNIAEGTDAAVIKMAKDTQTKVVSLENNFSAVADTVKSIQEYLKQRLGQPTVQPVTSAHAMEQSIGMGNTVFKSYSWVSDQIEEALKSRAAQDLTYGILANTDTQLTPDLLQEKGNKQKKAIHTRLDKVAWNGQCPILDWVKFLGDAFREYSISALTLEEKKMVVWSSIHYEKQQELDHIRPGSPSFQHDTMPAYVARIVSIYEPELYSERFRNAYESRKQMRQESATQYIISKWGLYR